MTRIKYKRFIEVENSYGKLHAVQYYFPRVHECAHYSLEIKENVKRNVPDTCTWIDVFKMHHDQQGKEIVFEVHGEPGHTDTYAV